MGEVEIGRGSRLSGLWDDPPGSVAEQVWRLMNELTLGIGSDRMAEVALGMGLNRTQARLLMQLGACPSLSQKQAAELLHCDPSTVTILADKLEELRLVRRQVDHSDRRGRALSLTAKGKRVRRALIDSVFAVPETLSLLPPRDQEALRDLLGKITAQA